MSNVATLLEQQLSPPQVSLLKRAASLSAQLGLQPYLVGGTVRDLLLEAGTSTPDLDIAVVGGAEESVSELARRFGGTAVARSPFGTAKLDVGGVILDISMARRESYAHPGALPKVTPGTMDDDLARRDFTINSMAVSLADGEAWGALLDPLDGRHDLRRGVIRVLHSKSFVDDPTRILRALRYAGRLGFELDGETLRLVRRDRGYLESLTGDRARHELERIFREAAVATILEHAQWLGTLTAIHPELHVGRRALSTLRRLDVAPTVENDLTVIAALSFSVSEAGRGSLAARLNMDRRWSRVVRHVGRLRGVFGAIGAPDLRRRQIHQLLQSYDVVSIEVCAQLADDQLVQERLLLYLNELRHVRPSLKGGDLLRLGVPEGPQVGDLLEELLWGRVDEVLKTRRDEERLVINSLRGAAG